MRRDRLSLPVLALASGQTLAWAAMFYSFAALFHAFETDLAYSKERIAAAFSLAILLSALLSPLCGRIIDRGHGRILLGTAPLLGGIGLLFLANAQNHGQFILAWLVIGVAQSGSLYEPCFSFVTRTLQGDARPAIVRITLVAGFASALAFPLGAVLAGSFGWRVAAVCFAGMSAFAAAPLLYLGATRLEREYGHRADRAEPSRRPRHAVSQAMRQRAFWLIAIAFSAIALNHGILVNHVVPLLMDRGLSHPLAVLAASTIGPMLVAGRVAMWRVEHLCSTGTLAIASFTGVLASSFLLAGTGLAWPLAFLFAATQGASYGLVSILKPVLIAETLGREDFGTISGSLALPYLAGFAAAPWLGGWLWSLGGYDPVIALAAILATTALTAITWLERTALR
ncbi:MAG: MFS transporter [Geminicoccaceae bacterium]